MKNYIITLFLLSTVLFTQNVKADYYYILTNDGYQVDVTYEFLSSIFKNSDDSLTVSLEIKKLDKSVYFSKKSYKGMNSGKIIQKYLDKFQIKVPEGRYVSTLNFGTLSGKSESLSFEMNINTGRNIKKTPVVFANSISNLTEKSQHNFAGFEFNHNIAGEYQLNENNTMFWYFEWYAEDEKNLNYKVEFVKLGESSPARTKEMMLTKVDGYSYSLGQYNVMAKLKNGEYTAVFKYDNQIFHSKKITVIKQAKKKANSSENILVTKSIEDDLLVIKILSTTEQYNVLKNSSRSGQEKLITKFWNNTAIGYNVSTNELFDVIKSNISFLREMYPVKGKRNVLKTDVAYVILKYGKPFTIDRVQETTNEKRYEIWKYPNIENGADFYLCDTYGFGHLSLIYSTYSEEPLSNHASWEHKIKKIRGIGLSGPTTE